MSRVVGPPRAPHIHEFLVGIENDPHLVTELTKPRLDTRHRLKAFDSRRVYERFVWARPGTLRTRLTHAGGKSAVVHNNDARPLLAINVEQIERSAIDVDGVAERVVANRSSDDSSWSERW